MFPQMGPQFSQEMTNQAPTTSLVSQNTSLTGASPFQSPQLPDFNTTAPSSGMMHPAVQNMIKALKGGT